MHSLYIKKFNINLGKFENTIHFAISRITYIRIVNFESGISLKNQSPAIKCNIYNYIYLYLTLFIYNY